MVGAAILLTACRAGTDDPAQPQPSSAPPQEDAIFDLSFDIESRYRPFELIANEVGSADAPAHQGLQLSRTGPEAPFCAVEATVAGSSGKVLLGLAVEDGDNLLGWYDADSSRVGIDVRSGGRKRTIRRRKVDLPTSFRLGVALCENQLTVLADTGDGWEPLLTERNKIRALVDMRDAVRLGKHRYAHGYGEDPGQRLTSVRWGLFGMTGIRDQHLVQHATGRRTSGTARRTSPAPAPASGSSSRPTGECSPSTWPAKRLEQVAQLYFRRDGLLLGDHAGQIVRDDDRDEWIVANSSWGDFDFKGVHVRTPDHHRRHLSAGCTSWRRERTALPTDQSSWDPGMTRIDGTLVRRVRGEPLAETLRLPPRAGRQHPKLRPGTRSWSWWAPRRAAPDRGTDPGAGAGHWLVPGHRRGCPALPRLRPVDATRRAARCAVRDQHSAPAAPAARPTVGSCSSPSTAPSTPRTDGVRRARRRPDHAQLKDHERETSAPSRPGASAGLVERDGAPLELSDRVAHRPDEDLASAGSGVRRECLGQCCALPIGRCLSFSGSRLSVGASTSTRTCSASSRLSVTWSQVVATASGKDVRGPDRPRAGGRRAGPRASAYWSVSRCTPRRTSRPPRQPSRRAVGRTPSWRTRSRGGGSGRRHRCRSRPSRTSRSQRAPPGPVRARAAGPRRTATSAPRTGCRQPRSRAGWTPGPRPPTTGPPARTASVVSVLATTAGWRMTGSVMLVASAMSPAEAATLASAVCRRATGGSRRGGRWRPPS